MRNLRLRKAESRTVAVGLGGKGNGEMLVEVYKGLVMQDDYVLWSEWTARLSIVNPVLYI